MHPEFLLSLTEFPAAGIITSEPVEDAVDDEQPILSSHEIFRQLQELFVLGLAVVDVMVENVLIDFIPIDYRASVLRRKAEHRHDTFKPLGNLGNSLRTKGAFGVEHGHFTIGATTLLWQLSHDAQGMSQLGLSAAKFTKDLADAPGLEAATKDVVERGATSFDPEALLPLPPEISAGYESTAAVLRAH
jgi:hypothetical protein